MRGVLPAESTENRFYCASRYSPISILLLSITTLQAYDTDGNGVNSFSEFLTTVSISAKGSPEDKLNWSFDQCHDLLIWGQQTHQICDAHDVHSLNFSSKFPNLGHDLLSM